jgi:hypothetical protein
MESAAGEAVAEPSLAELAEIPQSEAPEAEAAGAPAAGPLQKPLISVLVADAPAESRGGLRYSPSLAAIEAALIGLRDPSFAFGTSALPVTYDAPPFALRLSPVRDELLPGCEQTQSPEKRAPCFQSSCRGHEHPVDVASGNRPTAGSPLRRRHAPDGDL